MVRHCASTLMTKAAGNEGSWFQRTPSVRMVYAKQPTCQVVALHSRPLGELTSIKIRVFSEFAVSPGQTRPSLMPGFRTGCPNAVPFLDRSSTLLHLTRELLDL